MDIADIIGHRVAAVLQTPWRSSVQEEIPGLTGPIWKSCDCYVRLESGMLVKLGYGDLQSRIVIIGESEPSPTGLVPADVEGEASACIGARIVGIKTSELSESGYLVLSSGMYLWNEHGPGGTHLLVRPIEKYDRNLARVGETMRSMVTQPGGSP